MSNNQDNDYRNKNAKFRQQKKNQKNQMKKSYKDKFSFMDDEGSSNINDIPKSIQEEMKNNLAKQNNNDANSNSTPNKLHNDNFIVSQDDDIEEYEEYSPEYFEPQVYVKK
jgi:hypothetical protein